MKNFKVRFNLGRGKNYLKWKVTSPSGSVKYYDPNNVSLLMENCKLVNQQGTAKKIHDGANKTVCAWIECETLYACRPYNELPTNATKISYNPRVQPNWVCDGEIVDKGRYDRLYSFENGVYQSLISDEIEDMDKLVDSAIERIKEDINCGDLTAIDELLRFVPKENLIGFLPDII